VRNFSPSQSLTVAFLALGLLCVYGWRHNYHQSVPSPQPLSTYVFLQITGEVEAPGTYSFEKPVTLSEAVARAGGLLRFLKWRAQSGWGGVELDNTRRIHIKEAPDGYAALRMGWMHVPSRLALGVPLDINQASIADLSLVPGVSEILAERIVMKRKRTGGFSRVDDLRRVKGIGPVTVRKLRPFLTLTTEH